MRRARLMLGIALFAATLGVDARPQNAPAVDARITVLNCDGQFKENKTSAEAPLKRTRDLWKGLVAGNQVRCTGDGTMDVFRPDGTKTIGSADGWLPIEAAPKDPPFPQIVRALTKYGIPGATRGQRTPILWPSENSAVRPSHLVVRWTALPQTISLAILSDANDIALWGPVNVSGDAGSYESNAIDAALAKYKTQPGNSNLILALKLANSADPAEVHFSLLGVRELKDLNAQLDFWQAHAQGLPLQMGRGDVYVSHKLFAEAAGEYDAALNSAPESPDLLHYAIGANCRAGKIARVEELETRLAAQGTESPDSISKLCSR